MEPQKSEQHGVSGYPTPTMDELNLIQNLSQTLSQTLSETLNQNLSQTFTQNLGHNLNSNSNVNQKKRRRTLTLEQKLRLIEDSKKPGFSGVKAAKELNIGRSTVSEILKNEGRVRESISKSRNKMQKRASSGRNPDMENRLYEWFQGKQEEGNTPDGPAIREKAKALVAEIDPDSSFRCSEGWLHRWKFRYNINQKKAKSDEMEVLCAPEQFPGCDEEVGQFLRERYFSRFGIPPPTSSYGDESNANEVDGGETPQQNSLLSSGLSKEEDEIVVDHDEMRQDGDDDNDDDHRVIGEDGDDEEDDDSTPVSPEICLNAVRIVRQFCQDKGMDLPIHLSLLAIENHCKEMLGARENSNE